MTKKYDLENDIKDILFNIKNSPFDEFIKIFWNDLDRLILDSLSLYKIPNSFTSRNDILFNSLENTKNTYLLFVYSLFFKKKYLPKSLLNYNQAVAWNNSLSIQKYAKIKNIKLQYTRNYDWFDKKKNISFNEKKFGIFVFSQIKKAISSFNSDKKLKKKLIYDLNLFYSWASHQLEFNSKLKMPKYFFSATMGSPLNRIMAINILKNGGKVFVFDHGVGAGLKKFGGERVILDLVYSSVFITFNKKMKDAVKENIKILKNWIKVYRKDNLKIDFIKLKKKILRQNNFEIKKIVFVLATTEEKYFKGSKKMHHNEIIFNMVRKVFNLCKKKNIYFCAKIHPQHTSKKFLNLLKKENIHIDNSKFEENSWENTAFVFDNLETSAFKSACITDKPIVFFEQKRLSLTETVNKEISKRCEKIKWLFQQNNNIEFNDQAFYRAIKKSINKRTSKNLIKYMY